MGRPVVTTAEVRSAGRSGRLDVPSGAIITAAASDLADDLHVTLARAEIDRSAPGRSRPDEDDLALRVRTIVQTLLATDGGRAIPAPVPARNPVKLVRAQDAQPQPFDHPGDRSQAVTTVDVVTADDGAPMAAGYMTLTAGTFPWHLDYDEIQIVLEGELHIGSPSGNRIARAGDIIYVPKGSSITFGTPTWAKFVYVTHPADWENKG